MKLESLKANNFRNLSGHVSFGPGLNVFAGENGQGKTNWLEAIAVLASTRSFRTAKLQETINFDAAEATVSGAVRESPEIVRDLSITISGNRKTVMVNGKKEPLQRYAEQLTAVVFSSDELEIVRGSPEGRRRFLDAGIVSLHPPFGRVFSDYNRVIKQKNSLLQAARDDGRSLEATADLLEPWNQQLADFGAKIHKARVRFVERLNQVLEKRLFEREELAIKYVSSLEDKGDLADYEGLITERLRLRVQAELASGYASIGPHRDDIDLRFDGHDLRKFGSAGQQRSALLLMLLATIAVFHSTRGESPVFLIDDIDAEIDYQRIGRLLEFLDGKIQTLVTTSKDSFTQRFGEKARILLVENGASNSP